MRKLLLALLGAASPVIAAEAAAPRMTPAAPGTVDVVADDRVIIAAQPSPADFDRWKAAGVTTVINSRSRAENASLPFDPRGEAAARGLVYFEIPMGGEDGAGPHVTEALAAALAAAPGRVALHCRSGTRSAHAYAAHLLATGELSDAAALGWPSGLAASQLRTLAPPDTGGVG